MKYKYLPFSRWISNCMNASLILIFLMAKWDLPTSSTPSVPWDSSLHLSTGFCSSQGGPETPEHPHSALLQFSNSFISLHFFWKWGTVRSATRSYLSAIGKVSSPHSLSPRLRHISSRNSEKEENGEHEEVSRWVWKSIFPVRRILSHPPPTRLHPSWSAAQGQSQVLQQSPALTS